MEAQGARPRWPRGHGADPVFAEHEHGGERQTEGEADRQPKPVRSALQAKAASEATASARAPPSVSRRPIAAPAAARAARRPGWRGRNAICSPLPAQRNLRPPGAAPAGKSPATGRRRQWKCSRWRRRAIFGSGRRRRTWRALCPLAPSGLGRSGRGTGGFRTIRSETNSFRRERQRLANLAR